LCFAAWRLGQALLDGDYCGHDVKALIRRGVYGAAAMLRSIADIARSASEGLSDPEAALSACKSLHWADGPIRLMRPKADTLPCAACWRKA